MLKKRGLKSKHTVRLAAAILALLLILPASESSASKFIYNIQVGGSKEISYSASTWKMGLAVGFNGFYPISPNILIGSHLAFHRWTPSDRQFAGARWFAEGSSVLFNIYPSVRFGTAVRQFRKVNVYLQFGVGYSIINRNTAFIMAPVIPGDPMVQQLDITGMYGRPGWNVGAGMIAFQSRRTRFQVSGMYDVVYTARRPTEFLSFSFGVIVGM